MCSNKNMMNRKWIQNGFYFLLAFTWAFAIWAVPIGIGADGFFGQIFASHPILKLSLVFIAMSHLTISAMSIAFHRSHTHQSVKLNRVVDYAMQTWLWAVTSMSKLDWVSVHVYHHTHSDTEKDPHSPVQKGLWNVFFFGVVDYTHAKDWPEVLKIRARIPATKYEKFIAGHSFLGPLVLTAALIFLFGPLYGSALGVLNFSISPLFAVGGVNAIAHHFGYQNYDSKDNSRNIGWLFFLNWIIAGELDHNNHHKFPKSPSFSHRWFEFDIGWVYIRLLKSVGLARVTGHVPNYERHKMADSNSKFTGQSEIALTTSVV
jgi:stearoyl-CoA desaturase (delta-9 desaturase)